MAWSCSEGRYFLEVEIKDSMASIGGEKHDFLPQINLENEKWKHHG
jgi:hypothetical protein